MTAEERHTRADAADALCSAAFARALGDAADTGVALVAVGGYGRRELAPHSDLDVVLVHTEEADVGPVAGEVWYPLWDAGVHLDHAVRALPEVTDAAKRDARVALGLLDARHLAGDPSVTLRLRSSVSAHWRRDARTRLPELRELVEQRVRRHGELAHATVPDLKEAGGGLRDATVLNALVATWLVDVPHTDLERGRRTLLDVRDAVQGLTGRPSDRIGPELWDELAERLGHDDAATTQRVVREIGRRITHISRMTWRRVDGVLATTGRGGRRTPGPALVPLGSGVARAGEEVVVRRDRSTEPDLTLLLRAAAEAAERNLVLSPPSVARVLREAGDLPDPWPDEARHLLVRLLVAGPGLLPVWETLDETGALARLLPEWERVRLLPHASVVHRFTVDRHLVETCIEASRLLRRVPRPDLFAVAALLHDIGKGGNRDHSLVGEPLAAAVATRMGFAADDVATIATLVRRHLLLPEVATTRDLEDRATLEHVLDRVPDPATLDLLGVLTEADARATSAKAWSPWRAALVGELTARVRARMTDQPPPEPDGRVEIPAQIRTDRSLVDVRVVTGEHGAVVQVVSGDRVGLLAAVSGALGLMRVPIRSARAWTQEEYAVSRWQVEDVVVDPAVLREQVDAVLVGAVDPTGRLARAGHADPDPSVAVHAEASRRCTVLEVRTTDRPGVVHLACAALAETGIAVRSAHVSTLGPQAVDVFYVQEEAAGPLGDERAAEAAHAVRRALTAPATLDV